MTAIEHLAVANLDFWIEAAERKKSTGRSGGQSVGSPGLAKLREMILGLAVQGQLTDQEPSDESASILLERIKSLRHEKRNVTPKPRSDTISKSDEQKELPRGWIAAPFGQLALISTGKLDANAAVEDGQYSFYLPQTASRIDRYVYDTAAVLLAGNGDPQVLLRKV